MTSSLVRFLTVAFALFTLTRTSAMAQELDLPAPQRPVRVLPAPRPTNPQSAPSTSTMQIPQNSPQYAAPNPAATQPPPLAVPMISSQPVLPEVFRGCWEGTVEEVDSIERAPGGRKVGYWTPKTYRLCYKRVGTGPYQLSFDEHGVVPSHKIKYSRGRGDVLTTDGRSYARMRAFLHFDEYQAGAFRAGPTFSVDEVTMLDCHIEGDQMRVTATVDGRREDIPWFTAHWHSTFQRVPK